MGVTGNELVEVSKRIGEENEKLKCLIGILKKFIKQSLVLNKDSLLIYAAGINELKFFGFFSSEKLREIVNDIYKKNSRPSYLNDKGGFIAYNFAEFLKSKYDFKSDKFSIYKYNGKYYEEKESLYSLMDKYVTNKELIVKRNVEEVSYSLMEQTMEKEMKQQRGFINFNNGIYDINKQKLIPHTKEIITLGTINADYNFENRDIKGSNFERFIITTLGEDFIPVIQELVAVAMYPVTDKVNYFYMLVGQGRNGKGVLLDLLLQLVPECLKSNLPIEGYDQRFVNASIKGKTLNIATDDKSTRLESIGNFKTITSNEPIQIEKKGKDAFSINPCLTHISSFNNVPSMQEKANAFWDRAILIHFNNTFGSADEVSRGEKMFIRNENLKEELKKELSLIVSWGVEGLKRLKENGYAFSKNIKMLESKEEERLNTDTVRLWIKRDVRKVKYETNKEYIKEKDMFFRYINWCCSEGYKGVGRQVFNKIVIEVFMDSSKIIHNSRVYSVSFNEQ